MSLLLEVRGLTFSRDHRVLAENLDFDVRAGSAIRLEGPNGAGKTTLLRIVAGLYSAYEGEIFYEGQRSLSALRRHSHFLGHAPALKGSLSAHENLDWLASLKGLAASAADIEAALEQVGLGGYEHIQCRQMSAGQQRRVALARLFLIPAKFWLLDEPFTALDKQTVAALEGWIGDFAKQGGAVLLTTHHDPAIPALQSIELGV